MSGEDISSISPTLGFNIQTLTRGEYTLNICARSFVLTEVADSRGRRGATHAAAVLAQLL